MEANNLVGNSQIYSPNQSIKGDFLEFDNEEWYKISNHDLMPPFLMTLTSSGDQWMFIASNGTLTAGRRNPDHALFPYQTDDKILQSEGHNGNLSVLRVGNDDCRQLWMPFSRRYDHLYRLERNLYKNKAGTRLIFEEINHDLRLSYRYLWTSAGRYGFVKQTKLTNLGDQNKKVEILDGICDLLPSGISQMLQNQRSTLVDAYRRNELEQTSGIGIFSLTSMVVDRAEPSEALLATVVWTDLEHAGHCLLSTDQLENFIVGRSIEPEKDVKARKGAYLPYTEFVLGAGEEIKWHLVADVDCSHADIVHLIHELKDNSSALRDGLARAMEANTREVKALVGMSDGLQLTGDQGGYFRHFSNVLFNIMRGGTFRGGYRISEARLLDFIRKANYPLWQRMHIEFGTEEILFDTLLRRIEKLGDPDLTRLFYEYLPLGFSRRHGDPSRPWNNFEIIHDEGGETAGQYEGNWRDIFQNWEALAYSFPEYIKGVIHKFLNASTLDGYNPYRITGEGVDWEVIEPDDPWSYIGYWGDHQIIYLLKLLEHAEQHYPGYLGSLVNERQFVSVQVPYRIKGYQAIVSNPKDTIDFDEHLHQRLLNHKKEIGSDGLLYTDDAGEIFRATFLEKILIPALTKLYNLVPDAGIWLNTQRPEWNDANNAIVGNGASMVTVYYLRRYLDFLRKFLKSLDQEDFQLMEAVGQLMSSMKRLMSEPDYEQGHMHAGTRLSFVDHMGQLGEEFRHEVYTGLRKSTIRVSRNELSEFLDLAVSVLDGSIDSNRDENGLYHSYNIIQFRGDKLIVSRLYEMLEGQVALLSAGYLSAGESLALLNNLKGSGIYREDHYSYMLYPVRTLPGFMDRNTIPVRNEEERKALETLLDAGHYHLVNKDRKGQYHFEGSLHNMNDLVNAISGLEEEQDFHLSADRRELLYELYERTFRHQEFTGRSGTMYAYEGIGSIYWHMVSKLLLAVQENIRAAYARGETAEVIGGLVEHYYEIRAGLGVNKGPDLYGAFPTDAYSHTPINAGAQQPGLTGQVKEDVLNRWAELGVQVTDGRIRFKPDFIQKKEFLENDDTFDYFDLNDSWQKLSLQSGSMAFTYLGVPIVYRMVEESYLRINMLDGSEEIFQELVIPEALSGGMFRRNGAIRSIEVGIAL